MNSFLTPINVRHTKIINIRIAYILIVIDIFFFKLCSQCTSFFLQSIRYMPQSLQSITNEALKQISTKINKKTNTIFQSIIKDNELNIKL